MRSMKNPVVTYAEYLAREAVSDVRHEFLRGDAWAMAGFELGAVYADPRSA